jgi:PAS domain S-box-containing protein
VLERLQFALEASPNGAILTDRAGIIVMANAEIESLFGYRADELVGQPVEILLPERTRVLHVRHRIEYAAMPVKRRMGTGRDLVGRRKDGSEFPIEVGLSPIQTDRGFFILGAVVDLTERKRLERMKDEFVSMVSHELRTPLTSIAGSLGLLLGTAAGELSERARRLLHLAQSNSQRLVKLVNDILDIEKLESGQVNFQFAAVDIRALLEQTVEANLGFADTYLVRLRHDVRSDGHVWADSDRLSQALTNLISNAVKFSPPDGEVVIAAERVSGAIRLSIRDQGSGIPTEFRSRIFQKFAQADGAQNKKTGGTGLGLSIVKEIVARLGGEVGFDDAPGGGTVFYVDLPCSEPARRSEPALPPPSREKIA